MRIFPSCAVTPSSQPVKVRLSPDALRLDVLVRPDAMILPTETLLAVIQGLCAPLGVTLSLTAGDLNARMRAYRWGTWLTLIEGSAPTPPVDDRVELLVPVPVARRRLIQGPRYPVYAGDPLARLRPGADGMAGFDLRAGPIQPRQLRPTRLPQGANTRVSADGATLLAACDGEAVLRQLLIHVTPMRVHAGDLREALISDTGVFVDGSVREGARIEAVDDVHVQGNVSTSFLTSQSGSISVAGSISGTPRQPSLLNAGLDIASGHVLHAELRAGADIRLASDARHGALRAGGNVYLPGTIQQGLLDVQVEIGGGIIPVLNSAARPAVAPDDRQLTRAAIMLDAQIALHSGRGLTFHPCTVEGFSADAVCCRLPAALAGDTLSPGALLQVKLALPSGSGQVIAIAEVAHLLASDVAVLAFLQIADRDRDRITEFSLRSPRAR